MEKYLDVTKIINAEYNKLSKGQKLIADYILTNYDKAAFMTASKLGEAVGVSESTVVRFANAIGFEGYRELQEQLQEVIKNKLTTVQRISLSKEYKGYEDIMKMAFKKDIDNIEKTLLNINYEDFEAALEMTLKAKHIYIIGMRSSYFLAGYLGFYLNFLRDNVTVVSYGASDVFEQLLRVEEDDLVIAISYPRYSNLTLRALEYVKEKNAHILSITDSIVSPSAQYADITLIANSDMLSFVDSIVAAMSLINAFIIGLGLEKEEDITSNFKDLEQIWTKNDVYVKNIKARDRENWD